MGITKSELNVRENPTVIPLISKVWVEGYGYAIDGDTGGAIKGLHIDVLVHSNFEAIKWCRQKNVKVKML
ncbi:3D domain-containing protein [Lysinibacillus fusiformis]|uniref:3D domain-containing protein n=1 Tax=Lysinibacillus fusiformis TaxID=28031 RepID=UPI00301656DD